MFRHRPWLYKSISIAALGAMPSFTSWADKIPSLLHANESPIVEEFADVQVLKYQVPGFDSLSSRQRTLLYYLSLAAKAGRDITYDQYFKHNLTIRDTLEAVLKHHEHGAKGQDSQFEEVKTYLKRVWFSSGIHHHYSNDKFVPGFTRDFFVSLINDMPVSLLPVAAGEGSQEFALRLAEIIFNPDVAPKKVCLDEGVDHVKDSAVNFFEGLSQEEVEEYYHKLESSEAEPPSHGLNAKLVKQADGSIVPQVYKVGGMYGDQLAWMVYWLERAVDYAESEAQKQTIQALISYFKTGDLQEFNRFNKLWVADTESVVDFILGFIETYDDPTGHVGTFEGIVYFKDLKLTEKFGVLASEAQWFEDHSPTDPQFKRPSVTGVSYNVITVVGESGGASPATPIGVNLPNADWLREKYGSKSVSLRNIEDAYDQAAHGSPAMSEFYTAEQIELLDKYSVVVDQLTTGLHEVVGHASGRLLEGVSSSALKGYHSALEEARADLVALYYIGDQHLVDLDLTPTTEVMKAEYVQYLVNGLYRQLTRIEAGKNVEEAHMRNRQMISRWVYEQGKAEKVVELVEADGTVVDYNEIDPAGQVFVRINDFQKVRELVGQLLAEVQRIKSTGDYDAGKSLIETYGVTFNPRLHEQILRRWNKLGVKPYKGFVNPELSLQLVPRGQDYDVDVRLDYPESFTEQMLKYSEAYKP